jgi:NAD(P)-dependent dehydrogenase (short-subunit alcohol dehydrogenase family)
MATVLITGANRGIGLEMTRQYAGRGEDGIDVTSDESFTHLYGL